MKLAIGCDHAAYDIKRQCISYLEDNNFDLIDVGCYSTNCVNYPIYGEKVALEVTQGRAKFGIVICGTGLGISMAAAKVPGTRVALCTSPHMAKMAREHNDANVLAFGARLSNLNMDTIKEILDSYLSTEFLNGRHKVRVDLLTALDEKYRK